MRPAAEINSRRERELRAVKHKPDLLYAVLLVVVLCPVALGGNHQLPALVYLIAMNLP
jgi:hypothetical protein